MSEQLAPIVANYLAKEQSIQNEGQPVAEKLPLPTIDQMPEEIQDIAMEIAEVSGNWNPVEIYTADSESVAQEKEKVFGAFDKGEEYNPSLTYSYANSLDFSTSRQTLKELMHKLRSTGQKSKPDDKERMGELSLERGPRLFRAALYFKLKDDLATCDLVDGIKARDEGKIATALKMKYAGTDESLVALAEDVFQRMTIEKPIDESEGKGLLTLEQKKFIKDMRFDAMGIKDAFEWALNEYGILRTDDNPRGYKVKIDKNATSIDVRDKSIEGATVFVPEDREMDGKTLLELIAHEIERHAVSSVNGWEMFRVGGGQLKIDEEAQYEGLGLRGESDLNKNLFGIEDSGPLPYYTLAVKKAEEGSSFFEIFKDQVDRRLRVALKKPLGTELPADIDKKTMDAAKRTAWLSTYRVMRGHTDMTNSKSFAMAKDIGYLRGYQIDQQFKERGLGYLNETAVIASGAMQLLAEVDISEDKLPIKFKDVATKYCLEVLLPQMEQAA